MIFVTYILFQVLIPYRLLQNIEYSFLCYAVGPYEYLHFCLLVLIVNSMVWTK